MGVKSGGMGDTSPIVKKLVGGCPPEIMIFEYLFSVHIKLKYATSFKYKLC